jgi:uncharacterized caspase-like protein
LGVTFIALEGASLRAVVQSLIALCCILAGLPPALAEKRVALIVGNASYAHIAALPNVPNDAAAMAALLKAAKFDTIDVVQNLGVGELRRALKMFAGKAAYADVTVLYYAGHGIEVGQTNYLIPVDARLATDFDVEDETVAARPGAAGDGAGEAAAARAPSTPAARTRSSSP